MMVTGRMRFVVLAAMSLLYFLLSAGTFNALGVVLPLMVGDLGMNWAQAGFGFTLLGIACGATSLVPAILIRRLGVSLMLVMGALVLASGFVCLAIAKGAVPYQVGTTLLGLGYCFCGTVAGVHVISTMFERRSTAIGLYFFAGGIGSVAGPILFYTIHSLLDDWRIFWVICAIATLLLGSFAALVTRGRSAPVPVKGMAPVPQAGGWATRQALRTPQYWIIVGGYTVGLLVNTTVHSFVVQHMSERGLSLGLAAIIISIAAAIGAAGSALTGVIGERVEARWLMLGSLSALTLGAFTLIAPQNAATLALFAFLIGVGLGGGYVAAPMLLHEYFGKGPNLELYSTMCVVSTLAAIGPALGGIVRDATGNFLMVFGTLGIMGAIMILLLLSMRRPLRVQAPATEPDGALLAEGR